ncbi:uncharacterized protein LOC131936704 [Physella acuta]|uniref:uncharacterized protein LOC131936704 n=1 Tax=Physella acuta TaxID=109671 RepID=UPI0027DCED35|nr:uncharacterized protein LOC131936704 [Physella acuta]
MYNNSSNFVCQVPPTAEFCIVGNMTKVRLNGKTWCIMYYRLLRTFHNANAECNKLTGGPNNSLRGHLVEIFSQEDNQVIRSFIQEKKIQSSGSEFRAFIGLYRTNNTYRWVNSTQVPTYFDVDPIYSGSMLKVDESMRRDGIYKSSDWQPDVPVIITETDWKIYDNSSNFVCQVPPNTSMSIACTDKEEGSSGTIVEATLRSPDILNFLNQDLSLGRSIIVVRRNGHVIDHNITVNKDAVTVKVMCDKCSLADEGQYVINVSSVFRWNNFEETCDLKIYQKDDLSFLYYVVPIAALVAVAAVVGVYIYKVRRQRAIKRRSGLMTFSALNEQSLSPPMDSSVYILPVDPHGGNAQISDTATYELSENYYSSIKDTDVMNEGAASDGQSEITTGRDENQAGGVNSLAEIDTKTDLKFDNKIYIQFGAKSYEQVDRTVDDKHGVNRHGEIDFKTIGHLERKTDGQLDNETYGRLYIKSDGQLQETKDVKLDTKRSVDRDIKRDTEQKSGASEQLDEDQQNESTPADGLNDNAMLYDTPGNDFSPEVNEYMTLKF